MRDDMTSEKCVQVQRLSPLIALIGFRAFVESFLAVRVGLIGPLLGDICATRRAAWLNVADRFRQMEKFSLESSAVLKEKRCSVLLVLGRRWKYRMNACFVPRVGLRF